MDNGHDHSLRNSLRNRGKSKRRTYGEEERFGTESLSMMIGSSTRKGSHLSNSLKNVFLNMDSIDYHPSKMHLDVGIEIVDNQVQKSNKTIHLDSSDRFKSIIERVIDEEFPLKKNTPTARDMIHVGNPRDGARYGPGSWVEIEGPDMKWRLDMITKVVKHAPDDWDWNDDENEETEPQWTFHYHAGSDLKFCEENIRAPEEGLKKIFGERPWIWQQYAILKLEQKIRFQEGHSHDCMNIDVQKFGADLWNQWLEHPSNIEFKNLYHDKRVGKFGRSQLVKHIQTPFHLIDRLKEDKDEWGFDDDPNISVFTYMSFLGAGSILPCVVFLIQFCIPTILVLYQLDEEGRCKWVHDGDDFPLLNELMIFIVFVLYVITILPDTLSRFYDVEGAADTVYSRLLSLRRELWSQGEDTIIQMIGFKLDILMSTAYESVLMLLNIYVILHTDSPIEVLLDALAFVFVAKIDEEIVKSSWWDPSNRWITAGAIEVVMAKTLKFRILACPTLFSDKYGISYELLMKTCDNDENLFKNNVVAESDSNNPNYLTREERVLQLFRDVASEKGNTNALNEYRKPMRYFGIVETVLGTTFNVNPIFMDFQSYRTWSRWSKVLYLAPVPDLNVIFDSSDDLRSELDQITPTKERPFANFYPSRDGLSKKQIFARRLIDNLRNDLHEDLKLSCRNDQDYRIVRYIIHLLGSVTSIIAYATIFLFPIVLVCFIFGVVYELVFQKCISPLRA